jgi:outer membrane protein insertion porin family
MTGARWYECWNASAAGLVAATLASSLAPTVPSIEIEGNRRVEIDIIRPHFKSDSEERLDQARIDDGLKALIETGLFQNMRISQTGGRLVVTVIEKPMIGRIGNKKINDQQLSAEIQSKPRGTLSGPMIQSDAQRIAEICRRSGRYDVRVNPEIIEQPNNRVDLVFTITEGANATTA